MPLATLPLLSALFRSGSHQPLGDFVKAHPQADGFILDLRGNSGGISHGHGRGGWFTSQPNQKLARRKAATALHSCSTQTGPTPPARYSVDGPSAPLPRFWPAACRAKTRPRFGSSAPRGAFAQIIRLPNGDGFLFAFANYIAVDGKVLEAKGVVPEVAAPPTREALLQDDDPAIKAAVDWIGSLRKSAVPNK